MQQPFIRGLILGTLLLSGSALAHFQTLIPSTDIVERPDQRELQLDLRFTHPMSQGPAMEMAEPERFGVLTDTGPEDLLPSLEPYQVDGQRAFRSRYAIRRPGDHLFYLQPAPYWEPAEGVMIVHYTKVLVDAYAGEPGWEQAVGFPVEIEPLVAPYGLWQGNLFTGVVRKNGQPVPFARVEVEWLNDGSLPPPPDPLVTQQLRADANGTFSYSMPFAGWWGFAALIEADRPLPGPDGQPVGVEEGGVIWVQAHPLPVRP
ncbi:DUF4198 domain-containing protein [Aestuariirhabdus litorea]|uniref:DUF4198 domain-containing protein n=1 Tax=Aestuariirhabdus litorea TaxID=2528527 RepID=A0A3P3VJZ1_9GAMM|nr:DUF4198 domain-containing protein [Aestuariirhabdus litorea]RRJ83030.1 DUF4198 domain-containing protein [Aestuariirhabdus litorea]RWW93188.1 DUF4198 domain-containing protein [Endozoicomonadaceae bacterium GTF-13]